MNKSKTSKIGGDDLSDPLLHRDSTFNSGITKEQLW